MFTNVTWSGRSGRKYEFQTYLIGTAFLPNPGCYIFCRPQTATTWKAIYIGETQSFADRLGNVIGHHQWDSIRTAGATHVGVLHVPVGSLAAREGIETDLRHAIPTPCNQQNIPRNSLFAG